VPAVNATIAHVTAQNEGLEIPAREHPEAFGFCIEILNYFEYDLFGFLYGRERLSQMPG